ncbi:MAG TPA: class II fructose-bisphosphate aldolase [Terriglobales bacterium]|jgi:fructose-bisphosphate aldolase class II|nr:class II fructose-bisphosphate aldolase [Terriglobales bacterium]
MPVLTLRDALRESDRNHVALGHFNFSEIVVLKAVTAVARQLGVPVLVGVSESEREFVGVRQAVALVRSIRDEFGAPVFLNADHTHSLEKALEAAKAGFDMVVFDASARAFDENLEQSRRAVEAVKSIREDIIVEGEIGYIGSSSAIHSSVPQDMSPLTTAEEAKQFVEATAVDVLAPALGTMHGMLKAMAAGEEHKHLDIQRIAEIKAATGTFLTLHGGSGTEVAEITRGIRAGLNIVHINTELRLAWRRGLQDAFARHPDEIAPYHLLPAASEAVSEVVRFWLQAFQSDTRAVA